MPWGRKRYIHFLKYSDDAINHPCREVIKIRLGAIETYDAHDREAVGTAFGIVESTVCRWKQRLKKGGGKHSSLAPMSRAPKRRRIRFVNPSIKPIIVQYQ